MCPSTATTNSQRKQKQLTAPAKFATQLAARLDAEGWATHRPRDHPDHKPPGSSRNCGHTEERGPSSDPEPNLTTACALGVGVAAAVDEGFFTAADDGRRRRETRRRRHPGYSPF